MWVRTVAKSIQYVNSASLRFRQFHTVPAVSFWTTPRVAMTRLGGWTSNVHSVNNGAWPGHGQLMDEEYVKKGRTFVYPDMQDAWGGPYGYTLWLWAQYEDPDFDPDVTVMAGSGAQCTWMSREHNSVIVSFGQDDEDNCDAVWRNTRLAIVTRGHPMSNTTFERVNPDPAALKARADSRRRVAVEELPALREYLLTTLARFTPAQLVSINRRLVKLGGAPVPVPLIKSED
jgi:CubicO group peptidase (beta-lactamase class C family)